jgi:hypothetical protein
MAGRKKNISKNLTIKIPAKLLRTEVAADSDKPPQFPYSPAPGPSLDDKVVSWHLSKAEQLVEILAGEDVEAEIVEDEEQGYTTQADGDLSQSVTDPKTLNRTTHLRKQNHRTLVNQMNPQHGQQGIHLLSWQCIESSGLLEQKHL